MLCKIDNIESNYYEYEPNCRFAIWCTNFKEDLVFIKRNGIFLKVPVYPRVDKQFYVTLRHDIDYPGDTIFHWTTIDSNLINSDIEFEDCEPEYIIKEFIDPYLLFNKQIPGLSKISYTNRPDKNEFINKKYYSVLFKAIPNTDKYKEFWFKENNKYYLGILELDKLFVLRNNTIEEISLKQKEYLIREIYDSEIIPISKPGEAFLELQNIKKRTSDRLKP